MAYDVVAGFTFGQFWPLSGTQFLKTAYALYAEEEADILLIAPKFFETIEKYCEYNLLSKEPDPENPPKHLSELVPGMVILLGNRLSDEELKNPEMFDKKIVSKN